MRISKFPIPTVVAVIAVCALSQTAQAQSATRQAFPWSSTRATGVSKASSTGAGAVSKAASLISNKLDHSFETVENVVPNAPASMQGETIYLDEQGNQITREQMQAKLTHVGNELPSALPSVHQVTQSFGQNIEQNVAQRVPSLRSVDSSMWGKVKSAVSGVTSALTPSAFKKPEGFTLPSLKTTWAKPKLNQPTTWFSRQAENPITFAPLASLPRNGQTPTSIDQSLLQPQLASSAVNSSVSPTLKTAEETFRVGQSVFQTAKEEVADRTFEIGRSGEFLPRR